MSALSDKEQIRYSRHMLLKEVGHAGQHKLKSAHIVVVGAGGLGTPSILCTSDAADEYSRRWLGWSSDTHNTNR